MLLIYFNQLHEVKKYKPTTVQSIHSMIKVVLKIEYNLDIGEYQQINALLKRINEDYEPKKAHVFSTEDIDTFFKEAPHTQYLVEKVILNF